MHEGERKRRLFSGDALAIIGWIVGAILALNAREFPGIERWVEEKHILIAQAVIFLICWLGFSVVGGLIAGRAGLFTYEDQQDELRRQERKTKKPRKH